MSDSDLESLLALASDLVRRARERGADVAEAIARQGSELSVRVRMGEIELVEEAGSRAVGMRLIKNQRVSMSSTSDLTCQGIDRFLGDALELVELAQADPFAGPAEPALLARGPMPDLSLYDPGCIELTAHDAISMAHAAEEAARSADARITNSDGATVSRTSGAFGMVLSGGFEAGYEGSFASVSAVAIADDDGGKKRRGSYYLAKRFLGELGDPKRVGEEAAKRALRKLGARKIATCEAPVVFDPDAARSILGSFAGCILGSAVWRKTSYLAGRETTCVASPLVTIVDDPLLLKAPGSRPFDGEGLASRKNVIVDHGVLATFLCDSYSARKLGRVSTASASRGGSGGVAPSLSNFVLQPGDKTGDEIVADTARGFYVTEMMGFGFNPVTGDFSRGASGFWIENGKLAFPVSEVTISANLDQILQRIDAVGSDLDTRSHLVAPTIRVSAMTVAGT